ncbi:biotin--[acetyl-CoA-carboxylase] ligase [Peribacillus alkalitolerans]|uniref:biotin--[acetyl-CoA-carboxylase] ligase n=1 Tax=Peribacillus alkalitolerans TaxID=1550385 RepID=UPI0013D01A6F|nr:biotin--[acetyl-CoA-carboxylase] ligase [Peribacillus alkalitolerans]
MQSEIRNKLLDAFSKQAGDFVSGQQVADYLGCSRTAVWKHIEELKKDGYEVEAVRKKGYRILGTPGKVSESEIRMGLKTKTMGQAISYFETIDSTQKVAHMLANEGADEGTIVIAEEQIQGKGRMARNWHSPKYTGVWMSTILKPNIPLQRAPQLTLLAAVAVVQAIEEITDLSPLIKWPNDILVNGKKITGILTEMQAESDKINSIILGIGINVNQKREDFPEELQEKASSIYIETGKEHSRALIVQTVLEKLEALYNLYLTKGFMPIKLLWESYAISIGTEIIATTLHQVIKGKAIGITDEGVLLLQDDEGEIHSIYSADIHLSS